MKKRITALLLAFALALTGALAQPAAGVKAENYLDEAKLAELILSVRERLEIGDDYPNFDSDYSENVDGVYYYFTWSNDDYSEYVNASCDADGHIMSFYYRDYSAQNNVIPKYTSDELYDGVLVAIGRIEPAIVDHIQLEYAVGSIYRGTYEYYFNRIENGIPMVGNSVTAGIDYTTGKLVELDCSWNYDVEIPAADKLIGKEAAADKVGGNVKMELRYRFGYDEEGNRKAFLAYEPDKSYIAVDAKTGKIYTETYYWNTKEDNGADTVAVTAAADEAGSRTLSDAEKAKIEELQKLISKEDAIKSLTSNDKLYIDENLNYTNVSLWFNGERYVWDINMNDRTPVDWESGDYYRASLNARVDAENGQLLYFYADLKDYYDVSDGELITLKANYTKKQCTKIFESFAKEVDKERFEQTELSETNYAHPIAYDYVSGNYTYAGYNYNYGRVYKDIPVAHNAIYGAVDAVSGKVFEYNCSWTDTELPEPDDIINADEAFDAYINYDGFDLVYELVTEYDEGDYWGLSSKQYVRLVYVTDISPAYVDAFTGKQLNYNGEEYVPYNRNYEYIDIKGSKYERAIRILASLGIGFESDLFEPDKVITRGEFQNLAAKFYGMLNGNADSKDSKKLTRQYAAKAVIGMIGLEEIAKLDIYKTGYSDASKITKSYRGSVALAKGLGIMGAAEGKKFSPKSYVTRGEAAQIILNALGLGLR